LDASRADVVIRKCQSIGGDKGAGAPVVEPHRRQANVVEPFLGKFESVTSLDLFFRGSVIEPHAFISSSQSGKEKRKGKHSGEKASHYGWFLHEEYDEQAQNRGSANEELFTIRPVEDGWQNRVLLQ
jgi:hypothetical protein